VAVCGIRLCYNPMLHPINAAVIALVSEERDSVAGAVPTISQALR
jgi:hypothetical protein